MEYEIHCRDYLKRARKQLDTNKSENLFYAAFELRCAVEARLQQYGEMNQKYLNSKTKGWQIPNTIKTFENAYLSGVKNAFLTFGYKGQRKKLTLFYTPVNRDLSKRIEKLGELLHAMKVYFESEHSWWDNQRELLEECYKQTLICASGNIMAPPLRGEKNEMEMFIDLYGLSQKEVDELESFFVAPDKKLRIDINYREKLPGKYVWKP